MRINKFNYRKKNGEERRVEVMVLNEGENFIAGIDFEILSGKEMEEVGAIQKDYEEKLKPYMKAYRKFLKEGILLD